jgi:hypothetical protein
MRHIETDAYQQILDRQNAGETCPDCQSKSGHFGFCPLINRASAEAKAAVITPLPADDVTRLRGLGVIW